MTCTKDPKILLAKKFELNFEKGVTLNEAVSKPKKKKPLSLKSTFAPTNDEIDQRPIVYFDMTIDDVPAGTVFFELFNETVPKTAENFRALTTGKLYN